MILLILLINRFVENYFQFLCFVQVLLFTVLGVLAVIGGFPKILVFLQRHGNGSRSEHEEQIHYDHEE